MRMKNIVWDDQLKSNNTIIDENKKGSSLELGATLKEVTCVYDVGGRKKINGLKNGLDRCEKIAKCTIVIK